MMKLKKAVISALLAVGSLFLLAGCGNDSLKLDPSAASYSPDGIVTVVKGNVAKKAKLTYQIGDGAKQAAHVEDGTFVIQVPSQLSDTKVKLTATEAGKTATKTVTVKKTKSLVPYTQFAMAYNMANQQLKTGAKAFPVTIKDGLHDLVDANGMRIRVNVQNQNVVGVAYVFAVKKMKNKTQVKNFAMQLSILAQGVGADGKQVLKDYQKLAKKAENGQTTIDNIYSKAVKFETNFSTEALYMYMLKK